MPIPKRKPGLGRSPSKAPSTRWANRRTRALSTSAPERRRRLGQANFFLTRFGGGAGCPIRDAHLLTGGMHDVGRPYGAASIPRTRSTTCSRSSSTLFRIELYPYPAEGPRCRTETPPHKAEALKCHKAASEASHRNPPEYQQLFQIVRKVVSAPARRDQSFERLLTALLSGGIHKLSQAADTATPSRRRVPDRRAS